MSQTSCGCGTSVCQISSAPPPPQPEPIRGTLDSKITWRDVLGGWKVRWGIGRMKYQVAPGLYRVGQPTEDSPVLVTANYRLTVNKVRKELCGLDAWLLVLDTKGVNVWCAAGKRTFGTAELIRRVQAANLKDLVKHRNLVLPQLGATGVAGHEIKRATGFTVHYGPVRAADIKGYLNAGMKATPAMRRITFDWKERIVLTPLEIVGGSKKIALVLAVLALLDLVRHHRITSHLALEFLPFIVAVLVGGLFVPLLLPFLPFRAFALKGAFAGLLTAVALGFVLPMGLVEAIGVALLVVAITSYMAMMFTGATTFTTLAGAKFEVRYGLPPILVSAVTGAILRVTAAFI